MRQPGPLTAWFVSTHSLPLRAHRHTGYYVCYVTDTGVCVSLQPFIVAGTIAAAALLVVVSSPALLQGTPGAASHLALLPVLWVFFFAIALVLQARPPPPSLPPPLPLCFHTTLLLVLLNLLLALLCLPFPSLPSISHGRVLRSDTCIRLPATQPGSAPLLLQWRQPCRDSEASLAVPLLKATLQWRRRPVAVWYLWRG